ncbi:D-alanyl-D-alanine carboxypeptidase/D-alanyl-D-alanine-endopeptidase (penicillin-binding protein 4) [Yoonia maritima]|uniref:D-alanyl-D-alanine carboxypeptidase/D-alanyl-D-alanine-endopeptidase (Penicillin-binding protein 4) n=1 Tax=Yoonia maritima TaxID=1435347 RepID=A0A2T0W2L2_9RHOB|nr:D-alanyl-D-alanine carboxypeptidase/D-alanyl-D-alanine-endopeptidase [Yoonia maritima]PRY79451.1 D-alanyl-D-alanine carboxypeptidase/D-alanyl-D-alanine-endopeptidase (penicillin-binding protein 4) [Yoonia maritima]
MKLTRRTMLSGLASSYATGVSAEAPMSSLRPVARPSYQTITERAIAQSGLSGEIAIVLSNADTGELIEAHSPDVPQPPASVTKAVTALYALEHLGPMHQFETTIYADGTVTDGVLDGNLILAGGGDPNLVTDDLAQLAQRLKDTGLTEVKGDFFVWDDALVNLDEIDRTQLDHLGYNPTVTGLNLNFNRVHFEWKRDGANYTTAMDARSANYRPVVTTSRIRIADRATPVFTYRDLGDVDQWSVARSALNNGGSRWLPVRHPALYAGEVFATFARSQGIVLKAPAEIAVLPSGVATMVSFQGAPLTDLMRAMMRYSTNITAEVAGLATTTKDTGQKWGLQASAARMSRWARRRVVGISPYFADHSGLGDASRLKASDMVRFLTAPDVARTLRPIMKDIPVVNTGGDVIPTAQGAVQAKTGTLNFVSNLAGYLRAADGRNLAFAILAADVPARERGKIDGSESPPGARQWNRAAKALQQELLRGWATRLS